MQWKQNHLLRQQEKLQGIKVTEKKEDDITITRMDILNHTGEEIIGKTMGTYITIDAPHAIGF